MQGPGTHKAQNATGDNNGHRNPAVKLSNHKNQENATQATTESIMASQTHRSLNELRIVPGGADGEGHILSLGSCSCLLQGAAAEFRLAEAHALLECDAGGHRHGGHRCEIVRNFTTKQFQAQAQVERMRRSSCGPACVWRRDNEAPGYIPCLPGACPCPRAGQRTHSLARHTLDALPTGTLRLGRPVRGGVLANGGVACWQRYPQGVCGRGCWSHTLKVFLHFFRGLEAQNTSVNLGFSTHKEDGLKFGKPAATHPSWCHSSTFCCSHFAKVDVLWW